MRGHITERRPGVWLIRIDGGPDALTGRRRQPSRTVRGTRADAELELAQLMIDVGKGVLPTTDATVDQLLERWFAHAETRLSPTTVRGYRRLAAQRVIPRFGTTPVHSITTADLDFFYDGLTAAGLSAQTVRHVHSLIRRAYAHAIRWGWVTTNPASNTQPPTVHRKRRSVLTVDDLQTALANASSEGDDFVGFIRLATATGARRGELCALRWTDLDLEAGTVRIARSIAAVARGWVEKPTKTMKERTVSIDAGTVEALVLHRKLMVERAALGHVEMAGDAFVFSNELDCSAPFHPDTVSHRWARLRVTAKLPAWARLHDIRHAHATMLIDAGVPLPTVSERLGHANLHITLVIYTHALKERDEQAAVVIGGLLDGDVVAQVEPDDLEDPPDAP